MNLNVCINEWNTQRIIFIVRIVTNFPEKLLKVQQHSMHTSTSQCTSQFELKLTHFALHCFALHCIALNCSASAFVVCIKLRLHSQHPSSLKVLSTKRKKTAREKKKTESNLKWDSFQIRIRCTVQALWKELISFAHLPQFQPITFTQWTSAYTIVILHFYFFLVRARYHCLNQLHTFEFIFIWFKATSLILVSFRSLCYCHTITVTIYPCLSSSPIRSFVRLLAMRRISRLTVPFTSAMHFHMCKFFGIRNAQKHAFSRYLSLLNL